MEEEQLRQQVVAATQGFGIKCGKFTGAVTVEVLRHFLARHEIPMSSRDVFIRGLPIEIDLLVPRQPVDPDWGILYEPEQVSCVLEIKRTGAFGKSAGETIKRNFERVTQLDDRIRCAYVTVEERETYKWKIMQSSLGFPCFTLFWHSGSGQSLQQTATGKWADLVHFLKGLSRC